MESIFAKPLLPADFGVKRIRLDVIRQRPVEGGIEKRDTFDMRKLLSAYPDYFQRREIVSVLYRKRDDQVRSPISRYRGQ